MVREDQLRELIATMLMLPPDTVQAGSSLVSLDNSLGEAKLRLGLKRLGLQLSPGVRPKTFGELCDFLSGKPVAAVKPPAVNSVEHSVRIPALDAPFGGLRVGLDVQDISSLPVAADYWVDGFYLGIFDKSEIAYAVMHSEPRTHFAGFWCAREALRKCDPSFATVEATATIVAHEAGGQPYLLWKSPSGDSRLPHALSISHTGAIAMAIVVSSVSSSPRACK